MNLGIVILVKGVVNVGLFELRGDWKVGSRDVKCRLFFEEFRLYR